MKNDMAFNDEAIANSKSIDDDYASANAYVHNLGMNSIQNKYTQTLNKLYDSIKDAYAIANALASQHLKTLNTLNMLYDYADRLSSALFLRDDSSAGLEGILPSPDDIAVGRSCIDRLMRNANTPDSCLTKDEAWNLLRLFDLAYPYAKSNDCSSAQNGNNINPET